MKSSSTYKLLFLLRLLLEKEYTKNEIIEEFRKIDIPITKTLITNYVHQYINNGIEVKIKTNSKREKVYYLDKIQDANIWLKENEIEVIQDIKKLLIAQKNYDTIRKTMRLFYKIARFFNDQKELEEFINFGYYSTINWHLVSQLEKHCEEKNIITIDYILPRNGNKYITIHADSIKVGEWNDRLYLHGVLEGAKNFSHLPIDRIYMVKNVVQKNVRFDFVTNFVDYVVSKTTFEQVFRDPKEKIIETNEDKITIRRPIDDDFYIIQRLLYFCPDIFYISDERIKRLFKEKLDMVKALYDDTLER